MNERKTPKMRLERWARATSHRALQDTKRILDFILGGVVSHCKVLRREVTGRHF